MIDLTDKEIWKSKLARRFVPIFAAVAGVPLIITVFILGRVGQQQIVSTAETMKHIQIEVVQEAGDDFQRLGREAVRRSTNHMAAISRRSSQSGSKAWEASQAGALALTEQDFARITHRSVEDANRESLETNQNLLQNVSARMGTLFARSTQQTEQQAGGRIERAMLDQLNSQMQVRAEQIARQIDSYIVEHQNYLTLTAQMLDLRADGASGQKAVLDALVRRYPVLTLVSVIDAHGQETAVSASDHVVTPADFGSRAQEPYFRTGMSGQNYLGIEKALPGDTAPVLRLAVPIELYKGKVVGVLAAQLSLGDLWDSIRSARIGRSGFATVEAYPGRLLLASPLGESGALVRQSAWAGSMPWRVVVSEPRAEVIRPIDVLKGQIRSHAQQAIIQIDGSMRQASKSASLQLESEAAHSNRIADAEAQDGVKRTFDRLKAQTVRQAQTEAAQMQREMDSQARQAEQGNDLRMAAAAEAASLRLTTRIPPLMARALQDSHRRLSLWALWILAFSCGISGAVAMLLAGRLVRPIIRLAQGTQAIAAGNLEKRVDEDAPDEFGDLAIAFNVMAESLQRSKAELAGAEAQLVQSAKLASLGTLSAGVAHELNQPVAIVRGLAQQLQGEDGLPLEVIEDLALIEGQTSRMMKIIKHLRTFCRAGAYEMSELDVNQVVRDCFMLIEAQLKSHDLTVDLQLDESLPAVSGDVNELEQVVLNLITNARDAMEGHPDARLTIRSRAEAGGVVVEFRDNGPGIPEEIVQKIFDPFFTTKEAGKGTGLGLSISHGIIKKHHGKIECVNDGGAVFTIILPTAQGAELDKESALRRAA